ncbi:MAG: NmrA family NAD(P)-binding protein, partial [Pseudomonadota bacterium]|nr:NmrA family NAD(P)-binding protein [Pseudomonadota bacterium]
MAKINQITVFGGTGFIGRHLIRRLAKTGAMIRVPTRDPEKGLLLKPMGDVGQIVPFACSPRTDAAVTAAIGASDVVINLLGILFEKGQNSFQSV